ncbi:hypothetical protein [Aliiglaciecola litoralis]|uniref:TolA protein n=1 Tax=Aliiglaciecola litoralis TaxID=582857 RepID=A0ABP3WRM2_9ALTE
MNYVTNMQRFKTSRKSIPSKGLLFSAIATVFLGLSTTPTHAKTDVQALSSELEIMTNIMRTALSQGSDQNAYKVRRLEVTYLAGQGVVFDVDTSSGGRQVFFEFSDMHEFRVPPIPPIPAIAGEEQEFIFEFSDEDWQDTVEDAVEQAHEAMEEARERLRDLRHRDRDFAFQLRDAQRQLRDLEFELRTADKERATELKNQQKQLEKDIAKLKSQQAEVEKTAQKLEQQQKQKAAKKRQIQQQQHSAFISQFETNVSNTLCKYGNGLAALDSDEHVSFILANFAQTDRSNKQDKIYVFQNKDIQSCVKGKFSAKQLLEKSVNYSF